MKLTLGLEHTRSGFHLRLLSMNICSFVTLYPFLWRAISNMFTTVSCCRTLPPLDKMQCYVIWLAVSLAGYPALHWVGIKALRPLDNLTRVARAFMWVLTVCMKVRPATGAA
ncbi:unnamed protein product [Nezara viridula]|uniref:Uncharacterized protein n=1 Tax=Nezara viridula TaxID=85310 RepID=A0A9P0H712_NEZVI|nr:unnamed protein product [Nezara viridula]